VKVFKIKKGKWQGKMTDGLIFEDCPNLKCKNVELHYPDYMNGPHCPDCKTELVGGDLLKIKHRVAYHKGV